MIKNSIIKKKLNADTKRFGGAPSAKDYLLHNEVWYIYQYIKHMRYIEYYQNKKGAFKLLWLWHFFIYKRLGFKLHITIYPGTIGEGLRIYHIGGFIHVGKNVVIGKNCTIQPGVVFGNKTEKDDKRPVTVGDNCYFGLNAKILGSVNIGNNVTVGANAVVTKDIPDNAVVVGIPAKIIKYNRK